MISFNCDYNEGAHPEILRRLMQTNLEQEPGYGDDKFTISAKEKIRQAIQCPDADVTFLVGGTQTNATVIDAVLPHYGAVVATETGHIAAHESGAVEHAGHKVITIPAHEGKMLAADLRKYLSDFYADSTWPHMANPGMVYISFPTEYGTIYTEQELAGIHSVCQEYEMPLFVDGARLGYGLASPAADVDLPTLARLCDVFYIGGTKVGALCGEAVVFPRGNAPRNFFTIVKQHGALLAKGRLLGIQFDTLFTDNLYMRISHNAIDLAMKLQAIFREKAIPFFIESPTNQQFPILTTEQMKRLEGKVSFEIWQRLDDGRAVTRFATSWATSEENIKALQKLL
ncbi:MAG: aminotransferase class V-fold PLP-dependent enzyme [Marinilabiliaceae bacterium]|nr:aminotransferase class V-fold PLP-dependent enzyme [Marinilabiliaceae bacterium]